VPRIRAESIEAHKRLTRRDILDAAYRVLEEVGTADISLAEVAYEAGIGRTTLYEYFRDKDDIIASLVEERLPEVVDSLIASVGGDDIPERLASLAVATVRFIITDPVLGWILHREVPRLSTDAQERIRVAHADLAREMVDLYRRGASQGRFREMPIDIAGRFVYDVIMSAARVLIADPDPTARFEEVAAHMRSFLLGGLASDAE
jgi:AcrR family transcriptional regulator